MLDFNMETLRMNRKSIAILLVVSGLTNSVFAANFIDKFISRHDSAIPSTAKMHKSTKQAHRSYTNFSGTWLINCNDGPTMTTVIENDDEYIALDGNEYRIGPGLKGASESNEMYNAYRYSSFEWNADRSELTMKNIEVFKQNEDNSAIQTEVDSATFTMIKDQIILDGKVVSLNDITSRRPMTIHCVLTKKQ